MTEKILIILQIHLQGEILAGTEAQIILLLIRTLLIDLIPEL